MKILIADDDKLCRMLLKKVLADVPDAQVVEAEDGVAAWTIMESGFTPDLCILDGMMPGMSGIELLEKIRAHPRTQHLRVALCTTLNDRSHVTRAARLRVDAYIIKPFTAKLILREVRRAAAQIESEADIESAPSVCRRLGIDQVTYTQWIAELIEHISMLDGSVAGMVARKSFRAASIQVNANMAACTNLGLRRLVSILNRLEAALTDAADHPDSIDEIGIASSRSALRKSILAERQRIYGDQPVADAPAATTDAAPATAPAAPPAAEPSPGVTGAVTPPQPAQASPTAEQTKETPLEALEPAPETTPEPVAA